eukprot:jgi/Mesvir1/6649/Mv10251-RA.1
MPANASSGKKAGTSRGKEKKLQRKKELEQENAAYTCIKAAYAKTDPLADFPAFLSFEKNGLSVRLLSCRADGLSQQLQRFITALLEENMAQFYGDEWPAMKKLKAREMLESDALYVFAVPAPPSPSRCEPSPASSSPRTAAGDAGAEAVSSANNDAAVINEAAMKAKNAGTKASVAATALNDSGTAASDAGARIGDAGTDENEARTTPPLGTQPLALAGTHAPPLAFVQFRFVIEEGREVLYVYELQLAAAARRKGLGRHLMVLMELVARKNLMKGVMLTCQKSNQASLQFYSGLKYQIDDISPSKSDPL